MKVQSNCPGAAELQHLLDGSLSGERQQECTSHMDSCECCQAKLEELATAGTNLSALVKHLDDGTPSSESAYWPALNALNSGMQETIVPRSGSRSRDSTLSFLLPASDAAYLGRIAQFDVMRVIGRGGMGVVLEAFDSKLQRHVAVKVLDPDFADDEVARQRFCREARAAASISHENVVAVHQVERAGEQELPYLVMQLISGESLEERLSREEKLPLREIVRIGMQAAHGLAAAHAQGLMHRDIKPGNIMLEAPNDRVKLTDFGLARAAEDVKLTRTGFVTGTPLYMAPEQALGEVSDHRADLYSLGAVLYEMSAGRPPFAGNSALAILKQISDTKPRPLRELNPALPEWLAETIERLLAKRPNDRIQSAAHLAELLEFQWALMKTTSEDVPQVCQIEERKRAIRSRWIAAAVGVTFLSLGLLGGAMLSGRGGTAAPVATSSGEPVAVLAAQAGTVWSTAFDHPGTMIAMGVEDGSIRLWDVATSSVKATLNGHRGAVWSSRFAHQSELLVTAGDDGFIKVWNPSQSEPVQSFRHDQAIRGLALAHDDQTFYAGDRDGELRVWSLRSQDALQKANQPGSINAVVLSADDQTLATAGSDKAVRLWNAKTLSMKLQLDGHSGPVYGLAFSPDGKRIASAGWDKTIRIWDTASGSSVKTWEGHEGDIWGVAWSPDGTRLATGGHDGVVRLWEAQTGESLASYLGHKTAIHTLAFSDDGKRLASGGRDGAVRVWKMD